MNNTDAEQSKPLHVVKGDGNLEFKVEMQAMEIDRLRRRIFVMENVSALSGGAKDVLEALFRRGPLFDGDIPSKSGRCDLVEKGLAERFDGYNQLTKDGLVVALGIGLDRSKERWQKEVSNALHEFRQKGGQS